MTGAANGQNINASDGTLQSFNPDGFTVGFGSPATSVNGINKTSSNYVAWCWKAGNETVEDGTGTIPVSRSTNVDAGFSIIHYTKNGIAGATIAHGLGKAPEFQLYKCMAGGIDWVVYHKTMTATHHMRVNDDGPSTDSVLRWNDVEPDANFINLGVSGNTNGATAGKYICYAWTGIEGFSKFGSYVGNNTTDNAFVYLGFKPAFVIIKGTAASRGWSLHDNKRMPYNGTDGPILTFNLSKNEAYFSGNQVDFLANGFKIRNDGNYQGEAETYVYAAWAEMPFKYATAR